MSQLSLGIIETLGLAAGIQVADVCAKSANVYLIGYEFSKGSGMTVIKIEGKVGAVEAAVEAALVSTNKIASSKVIARPNPKIGMLIRNSETVGYKDIKAEKTEDLIKEENLAKKVEEIKLEKDQLLEESELVENILEGIEVKEENKEIEVNLEDLKKKTNKNHKKELKVEVCNICRDPKCTRKKGELTSTCINYKGKDKGRN